MVGNSPAPYKSSHKIITLIVRLYERRINNELDDPKLRQLYIYIIMCNLAYILQDKVGWLTIYIIKKASLKRPYAC